MDLSYLNWYDVGNINMIRKILHQYTILVPCFSFTFR
jgi:hypothetical protein